MRGYMMHNPNVRTYQNSKYTLPEKKELKPVL
jgi:hypothetical protein